MLISMEFFMPKSLMKRKRHPNICIWHWRTAIIDNRQHNPCVRSLGNGVNISLISSLGRDCENT